MASTEIVVRGAREHNLRDVTLALPRGRLICFTGVSGSGKSSLAFDTLFAEGQRRYVESLSSYARQFLGQLPKPDVDKVEGLSPAIAIQQKTGGRNPRSTVGTITEISDFLRVLYARVGTGHCPDCGRPVAAQTREQIVARLLTLPAGTPFAVLAPVARAQKGEHKDLFADLARAGYVRARVDGQMIQLAEPPALDRQVKHTIEVVIDRLKAGPASKGRLAEAVEAALKRSGGTVVVAIDDQPDLTLSSAYACAHCGIGFDAPEPNLFSFNSPQGMCPACDGLGDRLDFDVEKLVPDPSLSLWQGAIAPLGPVAKLGRWRKHLFEGLAANLEADPGGPTKGKLLKTPWEKLDPAIRQVVLHGSGNRVIVHRWRTRGKSIAHAEKWPGVATEFLDKYRASGGAGPLKALEAYLRSMPCAACGGSRLNPRARAVTVGGRSLADLGALPVGRLARWFDALAEQPPADLDPAERPEPLDPLSATVAEELLKEIRGRLGFLVGVGLEYLSLDRSAPTLSGGESQRIRLAGQVGAGLVGVLYILDEPSIGLHPRDNDRLLATLKRLRDAGNTVVVVEHDEDTMRAADHLVDFGPGPGVLGGEVVAQGDLDALSSAPRSLTGQYLAGTQSIAVPSPRRAPTGRSVRVVGARHHNLRGLDVSIPLGLVVAVTGVSGSGKSSLVNDILRSALARDLNGAAEQPGDHDRIEGADQLDKVIDIDQSPIGRTPRSNPSTYIKLFDLVRDLYTKLPEAKARGYAPGRFSFNVSGGRCEACEGNGSNRLEMDFLADVWVTCPVCEGRRFNRETLHCRFKGKSIADVLNMGIDEAAEHFANVPKVAAMLGTLQAVGLGYLKLGQPSPTLSGGEAQRIKLARELVRKSTGKTLYVLDEPTTGLHFDDVRKLLAVLHGFADAGNTVVVIEHNLDVIKTADWLIDLGPEGGSGGGRLIAEGPPEAVARVAESHTGRALARVLAPRPKARKSKKSAARKVPLPAVALDPPIVIEGARQHNLKGVDLTIPRHMLTVCSGPSGSGKSSLAVDTLYAEGQRRYVESLSSYARQFLAPLQKPKVDRITGLAPAVCIEQKAAAKSPRSTVGTVTEIHDYLRILFARLAHPHCPACQVPIGTQTRDEIVEKILHHPEGTRLYIMAPLDRREGEDYTALWDELRASGFARVRVDGESHDLDAPPKLSQRRKHKIEVVVDRAVVRAGARSRLADSVEAALDLGRGVALVATQVDGTPESSWPVARFSQHRSCDQCGRSFEELSPHHFSFNSPLGWCPTCEGLGTREGADPAALVPDGRLSLRRGAVVTWPAFDTNPDFARLIEAMAAEVGIDLDAAVDDLDAPTRRALFHGTGSRWFRVDAADGRPTLAFQYKGLFPALEEAGRISFVYRMRLQGLVGDMPCPTCMGGRLRDDSAAARFRGQTLDQVARWPLGKALDFFTALDLDGDEQHIAGDLVREIRDRLKFLVDVGLDYLNLARPSATLSGGEGQRIRLASQVGSGLTGVLYVLDEPTVGLHPRDNARLLRALRHLRDLGNTLVLVEHDREVIEAADYLADFGPGSGDGGGTITSRGTPAQVKADPGSLTGRYLDGAAAIAVPTNRRPYKPGAPAVVVRGARHHNLKGVDAAFPIGLVTAVTGVSGSGKSTLVEDVLWKAAARRLHRASATPGAHDSIDGLERLDKVIRVDQAPIGTTPNSTPATYTGAFDLIRELFARLPEAKVRGYGPGRFSFNAPGGRCEACDGAGQKRIEMHFLPDVWVTCDACSGARYSADTLVVQFRGRTIADVLAMKVDSALELFASVPKIRRVLQTLSDVGLGYVPLGQPAPTLSGGEAQRVKLAAELARPDTGQTLYVLDEPTTGLHLDDTRKLLDVLHRLADLGNTVVVIEHNLEVIKTADWVVDLGPEAGENGGRIVAVGTPEAVATAPGGITGPILAGVLAAGPRGRRDRFDPAAAARAMIDQAAALPELARGQKMPWQTDGRRWHTRDRVGRTGKPARWDGEMLGRLIDRLEELGPLGPTDWSQRTIVRVLAPDGTCFLEAATGHEWVLTLRFRVRRGTFAPRALESELSLAPFDGGPVPVLSDAPRFAATSFGPTQEITITAHLAADLATPAFDSFLARVVASLGGSTAPLALAVGAEGLSGPTPKARRKKRGD